VELSSAQLLRPVTRVPRSGWRAALYAATGGLINPGESASDELRRQLCERVNQRLIGCSRIAALSVKGGVGKSTTTAGLGSTFAALRGDRVIALDANPDRGNLVEKVPRETTATVRNLLADAEQIRSAGDVRAYTSQGPSRLEVLASEGDPAVSEAFSELDYRRAVDLLEHFYYPLTGLTRDTPRDGPSLNRGLGRTATLPIEEAAWERSMSTQTERSVRFVFRPGVGSSRPPGRSCLGRSLIRTGKR
jgi:ADP-ribose pyrophosphatase YjhB (NUDIX family)